MAKHILLVFSNPTSGKESEYNEWYDKVHIPDVLNVRGFMSAVRFKVAQAQLDGTTNHPYKYLSLYELGTDDLAASLTELRNRLGTKDMVVSDAIDLTGAQAIAFTEVAGRVLKDVGRARQRA